MRKPCYYHWTLLVLLLTAMVIPTLGFAGTISIRTDIWSPFSNGPDSALPGISIDIAKAVFAMAGDQIDYQVFPWSRAIQVVRRGKSNAIVDATKSDAPDFIFPNEPINEQRACFFTVPDSDWTYKGQDRMDAGAIAVISDYHYGEEIDPYIESHKDDPTLIQVGHGEDALEKNLRMLKRGRVTAVVEDPAVAAYLISEHPELGPLRKAGCTKDVVKLYMAFSPALKSSRDYARTFDENMRVLTRNGAIRAIKAQYGVAD